MSLGRNERDPLVGKVLGGCILEEKVGRGGMGTVYRATRQVDGESVAIKILAPFMASDEAVVARFTREVRAASRVYHPNVIHVLGSSREEGLHFIIMDFVDGENLADLLKKEGRLPLGRAVHIAGEVANGLSALHAEGIIHRDVKPSNILIGRDGSVKVTDFGIARDVHEIQRLTAPGDLLGTLGFAAPEQLERSDGDARADLYSLGATLHCMISGIRPSVDPAKAPPPLDPLIPEPLRELVGRLLSKDPAGRPPDAVSVASALSKYAAKPLHQSVPARCIRAALAICGGALAVTAGSAATASRGPDYHAEPWSLVLPAGDSLAQAASLFGAGMLLAFFALVRGRERIGLGLRSILGFSFLGASLVILYMAGVTAGSVRPSDVVRALRSPEPALLLGFAMSLAAFGLFVGMKNPGVLARRVAAATLIALALGAATTASSACSPAQAIDALRDAVVRDAWAWLSLGLAAGGGVLASRHKGLLWRLFVPPLTVFVSVGMIYGATRGAGSPSIVEVLASPGGQGAVAIFLALGARAVMDLRPDDRSPIAKADPTTFSTTPAPP